MFLTLLYNPDSQSPTKGSWNCSREKKFAFQ